MFAQGANKKDFLSIELYRGKIRYVYNYIILYILKLGVLSSVTSATDVSQKMMMMMCLLVELLNPLSATSPK